MLREKVERPQTLRTEQAKKESVLWNSLDLAMKAYNSGAARVRLPRMSTYVYQLGSAGSAQLLQAGLLLFRWGVLLVEEAERLAPMEEIEQKFPKHAAFLKEVLSSVRKALVKFQETT